MVDLTLLEVDDRHVGGLMATPRRDGITVRVAFREALSKPFADLAPEQRVTELKEMFRKHEFSAGRAALVVPRRSALVRELTIPTGSPEEIGGMIRFQLSKELPVPIEQVRYAIHDVSKAADKMKLLAFIVTQSVYDPIVEALKTAGVKIGNAFVSTQGLVSLMPHAAQPVALAAVSDEAVEVVVASQGRILMTNNIAIDQMPEAEIGEQIRRALMSYLSRSAESDLSKLYLTDERPALRDRPLPGVPIETLNLATVAEGKPVTADLAGLVGIAAGLSLKTPMAELALPPAPKKKFELRAPLRVAGMIAMIAVLGVLWLHLSASDKEEAAVAAEKELADKQKKLKVVRTLKDEKLLAENWASARPIWPDTLLEISSLIDTKEAYLTNASFEDDQSMTLVGRAKKREVVPGLVQKLEDSKLLQGVNATNVSETSGKDGFGVEFTIRAKVQP